MMKKNKKSENYLDRVPAVAADLDWEVTEGIVVIHQRNKGFYATIAQKFFSAPKTSHIRLDDFGSYVWQCIDGSSDLNAIGQKVKKEFGKKAEPIYERLSRFMETINRVGYIEFVEPGKESGK